eukprot:4256029-Prymnesium_polylepis.1
MTRTSTWASIQWQAPSSNLIRVVDPNVPARALNTPRLLSSRQPIQSPAFSLTSDARCSAHARPGRSGGTPWAASRESPRRARGGIDFYT